jgi:hypothetical protein
MTIKFAKRLFLAAGIYGFAVLFPLVFLENHIGQSAPPPITHPEFYYGFIWVTLAWQVVYVMMARDPVRFRPMLVPAILGKTAFATSVIVLYAQKRLAGEHVILPTIDLVLAALFIWAYFGLARQAPPLS